MTNEDPPPYDLACWMKQCRPPEQNHTNTHVQEFRLANQSHEEFRPPESHPSESYLPDSRPSEFFPRESHPPESRPPETRPPESRPRESRPRESRQREARPRESRPRESRPRESRPRESRPRESFVNQYSQQGYRPSQHVDESYFHPAFHQTRLEPETHQQTQEYATQPHNAMVQQPRSSVVLMQGQHQNPDQIHAPFLADGVDADSQEERIKRESFRAMALSCFVICCCPLFCFGGIAAFYQSCMAMYGLDEDDDRAVLRIRVSKYLSLISAFISFTSGSIILLCYFLPRVL